MPDPTPESLTLTTGLAFSIVDGVLESEPLDPFTGEDVAAQLTALGFLALYSSDSLTVTV